MWPFQNILCVWSLQACSSDWQVAPSIFDNLYGNIHLTHALLEIEFESTFTMRVNHLPHGLHLPENAVTAQFVFKSKDGVMCLDLDGQEACEVLHNCSWSHPSSKHHCSATSDCLQWWTQVIWTKTCWSLSSQCSCQLQQQHEWSESHWPIQTGMFLLYCENSYSFPLVL